MNLNYLKDYFSDTRANSILKVLLIIDVLFIIGHCIIALFGNYQPRIFLVDTEHGYPEIFQYIKYLVLILIAGYFIFIKKRYSYFTWFILFTILLLDDSLRFHERAGEFIANYMGYTPAFGLRDVDFGEITYAFLVSNVIFICSIIALRKNSKKTKKTFLDISLLFGFFLFFGIGVDMIHSMVENVYILSAVVALIEDGGEMIALSVLVWYFFNLYFSNFKKRKFLVNILIPKTYLR